VRGLKVSGGRSAIVSVAVALVLAAVACATDPASTGSEPRVDAVRLYVFDCGTLHIADVGRFGLKAEEVKVADMSVGCYLVAHPTGNLLWDAGAVPDSAWTPTGGAVKHHLMLPDKQTRDLTLVQPLVPQLAAAGYAPSDITYLALSHYHWDHTANAGVFGSSAWLVRGEERDAMFADTRTGASDPSTYAALRTSKTVVIGSQEHDVFGDGTVVIRAARGHTVGHQVLYLRLARTGGVVLSGDLYHYPEERALDRVPTIEYSQAETRAARVELETFLKKTGAALWIQHDLTAHARLRKAPEYYD
jgi:glyoxylase-like metal-dependent hydrolase (beta-lactamase superfamily II)